MQLHPEPRTANTSSQQAVKPITPGPGENGKKGKKGGQDLRRKITIDSARELLGQATDTAELAARMTRLHQDEAERRPDDEGLGEKLGRLDEASMLLADARNLLQKAIPPEGTDEPEIIYWGNRDRWSTEVFRERADGSDELPIRLSIGAYSPDEFGWGHEGPAPAQLALAILSDATRDGEYAARRHREFRRDVIARITANEWQMEREDVLGWVADHP